MTTTTGMAPEICRRVDELAGISEEPGRLTRTFLSAQQRQASDRVADWMGQAGMHARIDAIGNVVGRYEGDRPGLPALFLGSHLDTVRDAGKYDGPLGVVTAIACVDALNRRNIRLPFAIEVIGFSDEEGVRFGATMLGSEAVAGTFDDAWLNRTDDAQMTMRDAMLAYGLDPNGVGLAARHRDEVLAYAELHIEQGPVLEAKGLPVGCVTAINGASRYRIDLTGTAGHAGTVPMGGRRDALAAAAEGVLAVETLCAGEDGLVGTVGRIEALPGAVNVIPGRARFTIDIRAPVDAQRERAVAAVLKRFAEIAAARGVGIAIEKLYEMPAAPCAPWLMDQVDNAIADAGIAPFRLPSGAGHDGLAMKAIADIAMIFVRCEKGISHNPAEAITHADAEVGAKVLLNFIRKFEVRTP
jgi:allantoate deiminase